MSDEPVVNESGNSTKPNSEEFQRIKSSASLERWRAHPRKRWQTPQRRHGQPLRPSHWGSTWVLLIRRQTQALWRQSPGREEESIQQLLQNQGGTRSRDPQRLKTFRNPCPKPQDAQGGDARRLLAVPVEDVCSRESEGGRSVRPSPSPISWHIPGPF